MSSLPNHFNHKREDRLTESELEETEQVFQRGQSSGRIEVFPGRGEDQGCPRSDFDPANPTPDVAQEPAWPPACQFSLRPFQNSTGVRQIPPQKLVVRVDPAVRAFGIRLEIVRRGAATDPETQ